MIFKYIKKTVLICALIYSITGSINAQAAIDMENCVYKIDSTNFTFETIGIIGIITEDNEFCWAMDLYAKPSDFQGNTVSPKFSFTQLEESKDYEYNNSFRWENVSAYNESLEDWIASFYIFDAHYFIANIEIKIKDKEHFIVAIDGEVNLNWETAPTTNFKKFRIENTIPFNGVLSEIDDKNKAFEIVANFIDIKGLQWLPKEETSSGTNNWLTY